MKAQRFAVAAIAVLLACHEGTTAPNESELPRQPTTVGVTISLPEPVMVLGSKQTLVAWKALSDGSLIAASPNWSSSNPSVLTIDTRGSASAVGVGQATISATMEGFSASHTISVIPAPSGTSAALVVEAFSMIEFHYPYFPDYWFYAPQLRVHAATGRAVTMLSVGFTIPGLGLIPSWECRVALRPTVSSELNGEVYGDWTFTISDRARATADDVTATIVFIDERGVVATQTVHGRIVAGDLPDTYTGGNNGGACFQGYRPPA